MTGRITPAVRHSTTDTAHDDRRCRAMDVFTVIRRTNDAAIVRGGVQRASMTIAGYLASTGPYRGWTDVTTPDRS